MDLDLRSFEHDMKNMVKYIEFHDSIRYNGLQRSIGRDIRDISKYGDLILPADKTRNFHRLKIPEYNKLVTDEITQSYNKGEKSSLHHVDGEAKAICHDYGIEERVIKYCNRNFSFGAPKNKKNYL